MPSDDGGTLSGSRALERGLRILGLFSESERALTVKVISDRLRVPMATTYRLVRTLIELGYLEDARGGRGELTLGLEAVRLGAVATAGSDLQSVSMPIMRELGTLTGETVVLLVPGDLAAICVGLVEGTSPIRPRSARVGENVPYNGGATPIALFAFLDNAFRQRVIAAGFESYTPHTPVDATEVEQLCARVRARGYAHSESEYIEGTSATAAPIFDNLGRVIASVGVTGITERVHGMENLVVQAAADITVRLGGRPAATAPID
jgi:DNA-binding IclR family transcriptional regulator